MSSCSHCGAPLSGRHGARCDYCGRALHVPGAPPVRTPTRGAAQALVVVVFLGTGLLGLAAIAVVVVSGRREPSPPPRPASALSHARPRPPYFRGPACPIDDVTGDGIGDYAAMIGPSAGRHRVVRINGANGDILTPAGEGTFYPVSHTWPFCPGIGWHGVAVDSTMTVELFTDDMLIPRHRVSLPSEPSEVGRGEDCIRIVADDRSETDIALSTRQPTECPASTGNFGRGITGHQKVPDRFQNIRQPFDVCGDTRCYRLALGRADRFIRLTAHEGDHEIWNAQLRFMQPSDGHAAALTDGILVVVGARRNAEGGGLFAMGIDTETGRERWATQVGHNRIRMLHNNGRHIVVSQRVLLALDPLSGEETWRLGR